MSVIVRVGGECHEMRYSLNLSSELSVVVLCFENDMRAHIMQYYA